MFKELTDFIPAILILAGVAVLIFYKPTKNRLGPIDPKSPDPRTF